MEMHQLKSTLIKGAKRRLNLKGKLIALRTKTVGVNANGRAAVCLLVENYHVDGKEMYKIDLQIVAEAGERLHGTISIIEFTEGCFKI